MKRYLIDTNHLAEAIRPVSVVRDRVQQLSRQGVVFASCGPVYCELLVGLVHRKDLAKARRRLNDLQKYVRSWPIDLDVADEYATVYHELKNAGRVLSFVDITLASLVRCLKAILLTTDRDFEALPDIQTENWL